MTGKSLALVAGILISLVALPILWAGVQRWREANTRTAPSPRWLAITQVGTAHALYCDANKKAPAIANDLQPFYTFPEAFDRLKDGSIVFCYGIDLLDLLYVPDGISATVLAYEKDVPAKGGIVLMGDRSIRSVTPEEFIGMPLAKPRKKAAK